MVIVKVDRAVSIGLMLVQVPVVGAMVGSYSSVLDKLGESYSKL
jgi:hypothetical protein